MDISLDQARRRAKELLRSARGGDEEARARLRADREPRLADAQRAVAQELGFASWPALTAHVDATAGDREQRRERFLAYALGSRRDRAQALLDNDPQLPGSSLACALVLGDRETVAGAARDTSGLERAPILYVTHSAFLEPGSPREQQLVDTLAFLIDRGDDVNATFANEYGDMSAIYGAAGVVHNPQATRLLLEAGANPDDGESVYHAVESDDTTCLEILLEHGATVRDTNALGNAIRNPAKVRILLERGDLRPENEELRVRLLHAKEDEVARLLLAHGAPVDVRDRDGLTPYDIAVRRGDTSLMAILADAGGAVDPDPVCAWLGAVVRGEPAERPDAPLRASDCELLPMWASAGEDEGVIRLLDAGIPIDSPGVDSGDGLCYAGLWGHPSTIAVLLERGAQPTGVRGPGDPIGWVCWGSRHVDSDASRVGEYIACARALLDAGARPNRAQVDEAADDLGVELEGFLLDSERE
jgi:ankyrin repeat protein